MLYGNNDRALNGICPYFTMFPVDFPRSLLAARGERDGWVFDPFCGRGTTNFAARLSNLPSIGMDSSPVAVAIAQAKVANTSPREIMGAAVELLDEVDQPVDVPEGEFWEWAFSPDVLVVLCRLREGLMRDCRSDARKALRAILMGALHGPTPKHKASYFSNQSPRTYAPKPGYAVRFWKVRDLKPRSVDVLAIVHERSQRYFGAKLPRGKGWILAGDSRDPAAVEAAVQGRALRWVITSPPYYGLRTYIPDQWLRQWFVGGHAEVDYSSDGQIRHASPGIFSQELRTVWRNVARVCRADAELVIRFGGIRDRKAEPLPLLLESLVGSGWEVRSITSAGSASQGRRQAESFARTKQPPFEEHDVLAVLADESVSSWQSQAEGMH